MNLAISQGHIVTLICSCALGTVTMGIAAIVQGGAACSYWLGTQGGKVGGYKPVPITQLMMQTLVCITSLLGLGGALGSECPSDNFICYLLKALATL